MEEIIIQGVVTELDGDPIENCADNKADTFLVLLAGIEVMRASSRHHAQLWIESDEGKAELASYADD